MNSFVFLDTNILQSLSNDKYKSSANSALQAISQLNKNYSFAVNFFQRYEFLRGINQKKKWSKHLNILKQFKFFEPTSEIFEFTRIVYLVYKEELKMKPGEGTC